MACEVCGVGGHVRCVWCGRSCEVCVVQAFMFESCMSMAVTKWGEQTCNKLDHTYYECWQTLKKNFDPTWKPAKDSR